MRAITFSGINHAEIWNGLENHAIKPDEVRLKTLYSGVTVGTERSILSGIAEPHIAGYQTVSRITEIGGLAEGCSTGQLVFSDYANLPSNFTGVGGCGHMEERIRQVTGNFVPLGEDFDPVQAALLGVMGIGVKAAKRSKVRMGERVLVIGLGIIGQACAQAAAAMGADVYGIDLVKSRTAAAAFLSCTRTYCGSDGDVWEDLYKLPRFDVIFETTGLTQMYDNSFKVINKGTSRLMAVGMRSEQCYEFWKLAHLSEVSIIHTEHFTVADVLDVMRLVKQGRMNIERLITHLVDVAEAPGIYDKIIHDSDDMLGIVFDWKKG